MSDRDRSEQDPDGPVRDREAGADPDGAADTDATVADGVEHLQVAAREMIAAARSFLDVVEEVVGDNAALASVAEALGSFGQVVSRAAGRAAADDGQPGGSDAGVPGDGDAGASRSRVQHIDLS